MDSVVGLPSLFKSIFYSSVLFDVSSLITLSVSHPLVYLMKASLSSFFIMILMHLLEAMKQENNLTFGYL